MTKLNPCPNCGSQNLWTVKSVTSRGYWIECSHCHWYGRESLFKWLAERKWNKEKNDEVNEDVY